MAAKTLTVKEVAAQLGTDGRTLRKFLRHEVKEAGGKVGEDTPGKGGRYSLEAGKVKALGKRFEAWAASKVQPESEIEENPGTEVEETEVPEDLE